MTEVELTEIAKQALEKWCACCCDLQPNVLLETPAEVVLFVLGSYSSSELYDLCCVYIATKRDARCA